MTITGATSSIVAGTASPDWRSISGIIPRACLPRGTAYHLEQWRGQVLLNGAVTEGATVRLNGEPAGVGGLYDPDFSEEGAAHHSVAARVLAQIDISLGTGDPPRYAPSFNNYLSWPTAVEPCAAHSQWMDGMMAETAGPVWNPGEVPPSSQRALQLLDRRISWDTTGNDDPVAFRVLSGSEFVAADKPSTLGSPRIFAMTWPAGTPLDWQPPLGAPIVDQVTGCVAGVYLSNGTEPPAMIGAVLPNPQNAKRWGKTVELTLVKPSSGDPT